MFSNNPVIHPRPDGTLNLNRINGLDGLRAISVLVVLLYHSHLQFAIGGYLGVEIFFVISGFLITGILLSEASGTGGRIDLAKFWKRRIQRLLPALLALLFLVTLIGAFLLKEKAAQFRFDIVASLFYFENWYQIYSDNSYFADQGFPLLRHIWSLAVEEQFYLVWPLLVAGMLRASRGKRASLVLVTLLLFLASFAAMLLLTSGELSGMQFIQSINRVYLGTDTRAFGILSGALLAMAGWNAPLKGIAGRLLASMGLLAIGGLLVLCSLLGAQEPFLYPWGFLLVDILTLIVIVALIKVETSGLKTILGCRVLEYIGLRSYGIYLWHWPVFRLIGHGQSEPEWILLRFAVTFAVSEVSFRYLEMPIRQGSLNRWLAADYHPFKFRRVTASLTWCLCVTLVSWSGTLLARQTPYIDEIQESLKVNARAVDYAPKEIIASTDRDPDEVPATVPATIPAQLPGDEAPPEKKPPVFQKIDVEQLEGLYITAVGDSVMKGAAIALKKNAVSYLGEKRIFINAEESRSFEQAYHILYNYKQKNTLGDVVVIHLGTNNSSISVKQFNKLAELLSDRQLVLFLTAKSDKVKICDKVNSMLAEFVGNVPNARIFDWKAATAAHPEFFYSDKTHLRPVGARFYADSVFSRITQEIGTIN